MNKFLLVGDKFMPEMHFKQPDFTIVLVVYLPKITKKLKSLWKLEIKILLTKINFDKAYFQHDMAYGK